MNKAFAFILLTAALSSCTPAARLKWFGDPNRKPEPESSASRWSRADTTVDQFMKDRFDCLKDSEQQYAVGGAYQGSGGFQSGSRVNCALFASCLGARGYRRDPDGKLTPPEDMEIHCR